MGDGHASGGNEYWSDPWRLSQIRLETGLETCITVDRTL